MAAAARYTGVGGNVNTSSGIRGRDGEAAEAGEAILAAAETAGLSEAPALLAARARLLAARGRPGEAAAAVHEALSRARRALRAPASASEAAANVPELLRATAVAVSLLTPAGLATTTLRVADNALRLLVDFAGASVVSGEGSGDGGKARLTVVAALADRAVEEGMRGFLRTGAPSHALTLFDSFGRALNAAAQRHGRIQVRSSEADVDSVVTIEADDESALLSEPLALSPSTGCYNAAIEALVLAYRRGAVETGAAVAEVTRLVSAMQAAVVASANAAATSSLSGGAVSTSTCVPDATTFNLYLLLLCRGGFLAEALRVPIAMREAGLTPTAHTHASLQHALVRAGRIAEADAQLRDMAADGLSPGAHIAATRLQACAGVGAMGRAAKELRTADIRDATVWNIAAAGFVRAGRPDAAARVFARMLASRSGGSSAASAPPVDQVTFRSLASSLLRAGHLLDAIDLLVAHERALDETTYAVVARGALSVASEALALGAPHATLARLPRPLLGYFGSRAAAALRASPVREPTSGAAASAAREALPPAAAAILDDASAWRDVADEERAGANHSASELEVARSVRALLRLLARRVPARRHFSKARARLVDVSALAARVSALIDST